MSELQSFGKIIQNLTFDQLPAAAVHAAKRVVLDSLGCMVAGSRMLTIPAKPQPYQKGQTTVVGVSAGYSREWAAFLNGCNLVSTEMDEGNQFAKGHPAAHFFSALLAEAENEGVTGRDFLTALVCGYETAARLGQATSLKPAVHPHGNWGTGSASVAVAKLRGMQAAEITEALVTGSSLPVASAWASAMSGANIRNGYIGASNVLGMLAAGMGSLGVSSNEAVVASLYEEILGSQFSFRQLEEGLGEEFLIEKNYMKIYACCRFVHGAVDAVLQIRQKLQENVPFAEVQSVQVETYGSAAKLDAVEPPNSFAAKFSIPYSLAILLYRGNVDQEQFTDERTDHPVIRDLAKRISVQENPAFTKLLPDIRATKVTIRFTDGQEHSHQVESSIGDYTNPLTDEQLKAKFFTLAAPILGLSACEAIGEAVDGLEEADGLSSLLRLLVPKSF